MKKTFQLLLLSLIISVGVSAQTTENVKILELNSALFKQKIWDFSKNKTFTRIGDQPIILDFHAVWCRPCKMLAPHLQAIQNKYKGKLLVYKIDVDQEPEIARLFKIEAMPTIVFVNSKSNFVSEIGYRDYNEFEALVQKYFFTK